MAAKPKFTRIPKITALVAAGIPTEVVPTYCALADHANNKTGLCWPKMESLGKTLNRSVRTIQRHLHLLKEAGVIEFVERRRCRGRFSSYLYRILFQATTGHGRRMDSKRSNKRRTRPVPTPPQSPTKNVTAGYEWLFGDAAPNEKQEAHEKEQKQKREKEANRRREGFEWFFN